MQGNVLDPAKVAQVAAGQDVVVSAISPKGQSLQMLTDAAQSLLEGVKRAGGKRLIIIAPGERTGTYRLGTEQLVTDEKGESHISAEDFAVALLDEIEQPRFSRQRFTAAY